MGGLFNQETPIMQKLQKASTVFFCGICFIFSCLPIITIGAALTAMYRMMFNLRAEKAAGVRDYFHVFFREFKRSTVLWLFDLLSAFLLGGIFYLVLMTDPEGLLFAALIAVCFLLFFLWAFTFSYVFPLQAHFDNSLGGTLRNGLLMSVKHRRISIPVLFLSMLPVFGYILSPYYFFVCLPVWACIVLPAVFYFQSGLFLRVFEAYLPEEETVSEDDDQSSP